MRVFTRYKPLRAKKKPRWPIRLLVLVAVSLAGWWWWKHDSTLNPGPVLRVSPPTLRDEPVAERVAAGKTLHASPPPQVPPETPVSAAPTSIAVPSQSARSESFPRPVRNVLEGQIALTRLALSPGSIDGTPGTRTRGAILAFQQQRKLVLSGALDAETKSRLLLTAPPMTNRIVTAEDLARLRPLGRTWMQKSTQDRLEYESILELVAEAGQSYPSLVRQLNPSIDWTNVVAGTVVVLPAVTRVPPAGRAAFVRIELEQRTLRAFDESTNILAHFPCSVARFAEKRPAGELHVTVIAPNPNYTFDPENFPESAEARTIDHKLVLQPGPNNPVGTVWIGLDLPGYGIHGAPLPDQVGRAESHGCFRLANWNAEYLLLMAWVGMPVYVVP